MVDFTAWRTELWHPLTVHFPVALLLFATVAKLIALPLSPASAVFWKQMGSFLLYAGALAAWVSIYTGDLADGIVSRKLCDPTVLKDHENAAYNLAYIFSAATLLDFTLLLNFINRNRQGLSVLLLLLMLTGSGFLVYAGHSGAKVVYEQAGGVNIPASDCAGF
jgi:uncharacterized membrane protein